MCNTDANKLNVVLRQIAYKIQCLYMPAADAQQAARIMDTMFYLDKPKPHLLCLHQGYVLS